jgi:hypothetical protein
MEIAIPLLALGGMYVISNKKSSDEKPEKITHENFNNMGRKPNYMPNVKIPAENYPVLNTKELVETVQEYPNPNVATDKYFNQTMNKGGGQQIVSLTGNYLDNEQFKHSNMVPFNGGKVKGNLYNANITESVLDNMNGSGSQLFRKVEQGPLFKPEENMQWAYGAPNQSDFFQSRVNPGMRNNNVKPFESENVGPGLNQGYGTCGSGGYNSGMEARDKWREKTVDELRVATNPKMEYNLVNHEGPAASVVKNVGLIGRVEKQGPDRFFMNTQDRWFTTTGAEKGETLRPIQEMGILRRPDCESDYAGPAGPADRKAAYAPENFEPSKRQEVIGGCVNHSTAIGKGPSTDGEAFIRSHTNFSTHRSTVLQPDTMRSGFGGAIGAVIAPFMDILRPSRKEECAHSVRVYGEAGTRVPQSYVINPNDATQTTIKETTLYAPSFNIDGQKEGTYVNNQSQFNETQRDTTSCSYIGTSGGHGSQYGNMVYESAYNQHNNDIKSLTINNRPNQGGTSMFNNQMNVNIARQDCDRFNYRVNAPSTVVPMPPSKVVFGKQISKQVYSNAIDNSRLDGSLLQAFRDNPYTHSLTTSV